MKPLSQILFHAFINNQLHMIKKIWYLIMVHPLTVGGLFTCPVRVIWSTKIEPMRIGQPIKTTIRICISKVGHIHSSSSLIELIWDRYYLTINGGEAETVSRFYHDTIFTSYHKLKQTNTTFTLLNPITYHHRHWL